MYRQHVKSSKTLNDHTAVMVGGLRDDNITISNSFRVNLRTKNFILQKQAHDVDLVISIYEVPNDAESVPKALCENFIVSGWSTNPLQKINTENLRVVYGDIYKVSVMKQ